MKRLTAEEVEREIAALDTVDLAALGTVGATFSSSIHRQSSARAFSSGQSPTACKNWSMAG
jgi:hypothetical protein